ncbi:SGNH/GDSL hydrolase family protein [Streptomyces sp. UH6]|uniref:SGNH/GDSL hydrolase family protein n=1 Tax=Streptomyces sp. UH6 TaxID=2748379 RepID=UPI0015D4927F|nr:SGNH/GDSL hydrolase family protein [Streptomyces sp. UH6]NYV74363.1 SGNH/GDSL hydrolase family protein [Streptomyces sp. UH6]
MGALALAGLTLGAGAVPATAASEDALAYVALGDSMASGPLIPDITGPVACGRSTHNYPHELAERLGASLRDVTCSGAKSKHMAEPQSLSLLDIPMGSAAPQFDALRADTDLVTLTIGGNDAGLVGIAEGCSTLDPNATPCKDQYYEGGVDQVGERLATFAPKLGVVLDTIRQRSPQARVIVTGYGLYIKPGGCFPLQPVLPVDADFLQGSVNRMNAVIAEQSALHGAEYIDLATPSKGHDACQAPSKKWVEGYVPTSAAAPLHPNRNGEENYAAIIAAHLQGS